MTWDLTSYFSSFGCKEMIDFKAAIQVDIAALKDRAIKLSALNKRNIKAWGDIILKSEDIARRMSHLSSYISCLASSDARNEAYLKEEAELTRTRAAFAKIRIELLRAVKDADDRLFETLQQLPSLVGIEHYLSRLREEARRTMGSAKETLATDLGVDGIQAWGRLYDTVSAKLEFAMQLPDGTRKRLPMSQRRSFLENPDRNIREAAFHDGNAAWQQVEDVAAAALNAIAGTRLTLNSHRGIEHFLDIALFQASITRKTLDAMFEGLMANLEIPRRILKLKAKSMQRETVAWFDLGAPLALPNQAKLTWQKAQQMVGRSFDRAYKALGDFFSEKIIGQNWVDWEPRAGKRPGGFCTSSMLSKESRIFMTFNDALGDVLTLAHESGHAYHGVLMRDLRPYARGYPMTLAETASTFGEQVLMNGMLGDPSVSDEQKAMILDVETAHGAVYLLDIPVRYEFEKAFYQERQNGPLSVTQLKELMVSAQRRILGDVLEPGGEDPYFWASKLHFYITGITFYNFPYTFGFLLSRALYAMFKEQGVAFLPRYEEFLRMTGRGSAEEVVKQTTGRDIETSGFWSDAIRTLELPLKQLEALLPRVMPT